MKAVKFICLVVVALNFLITIYFCEQRTTNKQLLFMAANGVAVVLFLISLVIGFSRCFREKLRAFIPALICFIGLLASVFIGSRLGDAIKDWRFQKNLPRYNAVIRLIEKGELKPDPQSPLIKLPVEYADLAWAVAAKTNDNRVVVEFMTESGFPVKHSGYLFVSSGDIASDTNLFRRWPYRSQISANWFQISD